MTVTLTYGDVLVIENKGVVRIGKKVNESNRFISLEQANEYLRTEQVTSVAVDIEGDEVFMTLSEAAAHFAEQ